MQKQWTNRNFFCFQAFRPKEMFWRTVSKKFKKNGVGKKIRQFMVESPESSFSFIQNIMGRPQLVLRLIWRKAPSLQSLMWCWHRQKKACSWSEDFQEAAGEVHNFWIWEVPHGCYLCMSININVIWQSRMESWW